MTETQTQTSGLGFELCNCFVFRYSDFEFARARRGFDDEAEPSRDEGGFKQRKAVELPSPDRKAIWERRHYEIGCGRDARRDSIISTGSSPWIWHGVGGLPKGRW